MSNTLRTLVLIFLCLAVAVFGSGQRKESAPEAQGSIVNENTYDNPALGMRIQLPGAWQFFDKEMQRRAGVKIIGTEQDSTCQEPFCGNPEINVALISRTQAAPVGNGAVFLAGYKLSSRYLNRRLYPLKTFAQMMTTSALGSSGLAPIGGLTSIRLDGRPAYRLLVRDANVNAIKGCGYVGESNGYIFLLIGTASSSQQASNLRSALENMKLITPTN